MVPKVCVHRVVEFEMIQIGLLKNKFVVNVQKHTLDQKHITFLLYGTLRKSVERELTWRP